MPWPGPKCAFGKRPLDFIYEKEKDAYNLDFYETDSHLLYKVRSGKGDPNIYTGFSSISINSFFGGTIPDKLELDFVTGENDILNARASKYGCRTDGDRNP